MIEVQIDAEKVQREVVAAVVNSTIGKELEKAINAALKPESWNTQSLVEKAVEEQLRNLVVVIIRDELNKRREDVRKLVEAKLTDDMLNKITNELWGYVLNMSR